MKVSVQCCMYNWNEDLGKRQLKKRGCRAERDARAPKNRTKSEKDEVRVSHISHCIQGDNISTRLCLDAVSSSPVRLGSPLPGCADVLRLRRGLRSSRQLQRRHGGHGKHYCPQTGTKLLSGPHLSAFAWRGQRHFPAAGRSKRVFETSQNVFSRCSEMFLVASIHLSSPSCLRSLSIRGIWKPKAGCWALSSSATCAHRFQGATCRVTMAGASSWAWACSAPPSSPYSPLQPLSWAHTGSLLCGCWRALERWVGECVSEWASVNPSGSFYIFRCAKYRYLASWLLVVCKTETFFSHSLDQWVDGWCFWQLKPLFVTCNISVTSRAVFCIFKTSVPQLLWFGLWLCWQFLSFICKKKEF